MSYNSHKKRIMLLNDPLGARVILSMAPLFLHINHQDLPGFMGDIDCPAGIKCMEFDPLVLKGIDQLYPIKLKPGDIEVLIPKNKEIEGLFTIGSVGSIGQTRESDYDIWVVVDSETIGKARLMLLEKKLKLLQKWFTAQFIMEVHFFLMDTRDIIQNNFGMVSQEGSGSALKNILKEEFYRTMTLIEGRIPLWWVYNADDTKDTYMSVCKALNSPIIQGAERFIDMGDIDAIPDEELFGGALWQMHKALDDPLKSVLKMALTATYLEPSGGKQLLCNDIKGRVMKAREDEIIDPYVEMFQRVEDHYKSKGDEKTVDLLRKCFYLKVSPNLSVNHLLNTDIHVKSTVMVELVKKWNWSIGYFSELNTFNEWSVDKYRAFGDDLHDFLKRTTVLLIRRSKTFLVNYELNQDVEMEILRRRIEAFYVSKEGKIEPEKRVKKKEPAYDEVFFYFGTRKWSIHYQYPEYGREKPIMVADRVVKIISWLAYNKRINASTSLHMVPNASRASLSDIQTLLRDLNSMVPDANSIGLDREALMEKKYVKQMVLIGNMECPDAYNTVKEVDVLYINSWNEFFCVNVPPNQLRAWMKKNRTPLTSISIWLPKDSKSKHMINMLYGLFF